MANKKSKLTLIIDGNWLLMSRFSVLSTKFASDEEMCNNLQLLMLKSISIVLKTFTDIDNIIFVADGGSWRNQIPIPSYLYDERESEDQPIEYKGQRHLPDGINWEMVFSKYNDLVIALDKHQITSCRSQGIEGDDWCWYWSRKLNEDGTNVMIWSMDKDLTQLVSRDDNTGVFTVCWNNKTGLTVKMDDVEEDALDFFFNDLRKEYNNRIYDNILSKCKLVNQICPSDIVIDKVIRGDKGDNVFPIILKKSSKEGSVKKFRVSLKDIDFTIDPKDDSDIKQYIDNLLMSKKYANKISKSEENIIDHFKYNYKLVALDKSNYPTEIVETMSSYVGYPPNSNISDLLSQTIARTSEMETILESI